MNEKYELAELLTDNLECWEGYCSAENMAQKILDAGYTRRPAPEGMRLTDNEIKKTRHYNPTTNGCYQTDEKAVANAQLTKVADRIRGIENPARPDPLREYDHEVTQAWKDGFESCRATILGELEGK